MDTKNNVKRFNFKSFLLSLNFFITPIFIFFIITVIFKIVYDSNFYYMTSNNRDLLVFISSISTLITFIISCVFVINTDDSLTKSKIFISLRKILILGFIIGIIYTLNSLSITYLYDLLGVSSISNNTESINEILRNKNFIMYFLVLVAAPIGEEFAFKLGIFTFVHEIFYDKGRFLSTILPAIISATIFGIVHDGIYLIPMYFLPTFISCLIYYKYKNILPCILGHFLANFIAVFINFII